MSLYGKYRPRVFPDVVGQDHVVSTLENAVNQDKVSHAYLFAGSRGTGKTSVARILAKSLLIRTIEDEILCKHIVQGVDDGSIVDLIEIDAASNRGIDDIRMLVEKIQFSPVVAAAKVYIIDEVHMLTKEAFNALLKTLEEPPAYAYFILATTELQKIPATIQSRCLRFTFRQIREEDIIRRLQYIADQEHIVIERPALRAIAHHAQGGMRDAIALLDQLRALPSISPEDVKERLGESGLEQVEAIFEALAAKDDAKLLEVVRHIEEAGMSLETFTRELLQENRKRLHDAVREGKPIDETVRMLDTLLEAVRDIRFAPVPALVLESSLLSLCREENVSTESPKKIAPKPIQKKETDAPAAAQKVAEQAAAPTETAEVPPSAAIIEAPEFTMESVLSMWPRFLALIQTPSVKMSLKDARVTKVDGQTITANFSSKFHRDRVMQKEAQYRIEELLKDLFKRTVRLEGIVTEEQGSPAPDGNLVDLASAASEVF